MDSCISCHVGAVDECVGVVIDALKSEGLWDDTIIIVTVIMI